MLLFFDTETTGLPANFRAPVTDLANWPRMVQLAWAVYTPDGALVHAEDHILYPDGFVIPEGAAAVHGITTQRAIQEGTDLRDALTRFTGWLDRAHRLVAHNIAFDEMIVGAELIRAGFPHRLHHWQRVCTMKPTSAYVGVVNRYGYKWPKLEELHRKVFGCDFDDAHDATADVRAAAACYWELRRRGFWAFRD